MRISVLFVLTAASIASAAPLHTYAQTAVAQIDLVGERLTNTCLRVKDRLVASLRPPYSATIVDSQRQIQRKEHLTGHPEIKFVGGKYDLSRDIDEQITDAMAEASDDDFDNEEVGERVYCYKLEYTCVCWATID
ncbi:uncharacterized protein V2V93DRAFT_366353 [Kockiozyma suomiensis]|uniref:uncharacterized protein n=1 Tax=Kockiozyma suomiensis TaxID=1337062 RepID=UPI0033435E10